MIFRTRAREQAFQILFFMDSSDVSFLEAQQLFEKHFETKELDQTFSRFLLEGVFDHKQEIDDVICKHLENWRMDRISKVDKNILRLGTFELMHSKDVPLNVTLDEAVELGKKYGDLKTGAFVNGILDKISKNHACLKTIQTP